MSDLTVPQAAPLLGLTPSSVRHFINRGMIKGEKRGRDWFITQEEVDRYNRERRPAHGPKGRKISDETRAKLRNAKLKNNPMKGKRHTDETRAKMSAKQAEQPRGEESHAWKGGRVFDTNGYVLIYAPNHPAVVNRYVPEHRLVMERVLGRYLEAHEEVHHKNGVITDNRPENLEVLTKAEHSRLHRLNPHIHKRVT